MIGIYFSGTGNSRYAVECFCKEYDNDSKVYSIEDKNVTEMIRNENFIVFAYPVQFSSIPKIVKDFVIDNKDIWKDKCIFIIATMGLFSGDGAGILGRLLQKFGAEIIGGLHLRMPDSIGDEKALKRPLEKNKEIVRNSRKKITETVNLLKSGEHVREGIGPLYHMAGLFGQRLYFGHKTENYSSNLKIDQEKCIGCGLCAKICPMNNIKITDTITITDRRAVADNRCTMCYRCVNNCPKQAITLLGKKVVEQSLIEKYI